MKCENCGKNEVTFVYQSNVNGRVQTAHLCQECAEKLGYTQAMAARSRRMMHGFFGGGLLDDFFSPVGRLLGGSMLEDPFDDLFAEMPALRIGSLAEQPQQEAEQPLVEKKEQSRFARMRQLNALRLEQKAAVLREDFEKAAEIRDQIRELEQEKTEKKDAEQQNN